MMKEEVFRSKVDGWLVCVILEVFIPCIMPLIWYPINCLSILVVGGVGVVLCLALYIVFNLTYIIDGEMLTVRLGHRFQYTKVRIGDIKSVESTRCPISAPAASLHRLRIRYGKYDELLISPKREQEFIRMLRSINPKIEVKVTFS